MFSGFQKVELWKGKKGADRMIEKVVPRDIREYMEKKGMAFSDLEMAALVFQTVETEGEKMEALKELAEKTDDISLKAVLLRRIEESKMAISRIQDNRDENFLFQVLRLVNEKDPDQLEAVGFFSSYENARKSIESHPGNEHLIRKYYLLKDEIPMVWEGVCSEGIFGGTKKEVRECEYSGQLLGEVQFDGTGEMICCMTKELDPKEIEDTEALGDPAFESMDVFFPNPFEKGDRVRIVREQGKEQIKNVVASDPADWKMVCDAARAEGYRCLDAAITILRTMPGMGFSMKEQVNPFFLERVEE